MFRVEDRLWWYKGLRALLGLFWRRHLKSPSALRVLDVGCGTGAAMAWLSQHAQPTGIDFSPQAVHLCRTRGLAQTAAASADNLPFPGETFDIALSCDVLCHSSIRDDRRPLREIHRVLKPGGLLFLNLPAYQWLRSSHDLHVQQNRRYTKSGLHRLLTSCNLQPLSSTYWNTLLFPPIASIRLWRKSFPAPASDLAEVPADFTNNLFAHILSIERRLLTLFPMPFGLSIFVVAKRS